MSDKLEETFDSFHRTFQDLHNNNHNLNFSKHLQENQHSIDTIDKIMEILYTAVQSKSITFKKKH
jgi:hypothetical protein